MDGRAEGQDADSSAACVHAAADDPVGGLDFSVFAYCYRTATKQQIRVRNAGNAGLAHRIKGGGWSDGGTKASEGGLPLTYLVTRFVPLVLVAVLRARSAFCRSARLFALSARHTGQMG